MPTHERLGTDDREDLQDRRKPSIELDKEPAIVVREPDPALHLTPQNDQLMSECHVLCLKPALRLEWRGQDGQDEAEQCKHYALTLGDSLS
jgi:type IV secretory pathway VirD2 relaxase